jgi:signal transduction histidine kinase
MVRSRTTETLWRVLTAARVFSLAVGLGLAAVTGQVPGIAAAFLALCVLAAVMSIPAPASALQAIAPVAEGALVALVLVGLGDSGTPLLVYLVIPCLVAGLQVGGKWPVVVAAAECFAAVAAVLTTNQVHLTSATLEVTAPWMLAGLGLGLLGSWMRASNGGSAAEQAGYESAHRLLGQLRAVSRRLPSGLDTTVLAEQILQYTLDTSDAERAVVLVVGDGSGLSTLASKGEPFREDLEHDPLVEECWRSEQPQSGSIDDQVLGVAHRMVIPIRVGPRLVGVVVADAATRADKATISRLRPYLDEHGLRLEAALLFDQVRDTATLEERGRLAREIHDGIAQEIASLGYLVDDLVASAPDAQDAARELRREFTRVVSELRLSIFDLRSNVTPHGGLGLALSDYAREVGKRSGLTVHFALTEQSGRLRITVETELLRIAQEAITNARKHAFANNLWVTLNTDSPIIMLRIEDDGVGSAQFRENHYGLRIMQERANRIGGELTVSERPRGGTTVMVAVWPSTNTTTGEDDEHLSSAR